MSDSCCGAAGFATAAPPVRCSVVGSPAAVPPLAVAGSMSASLALFFLASASFFAALSDGEDAFSVTAGARWTGGVVWCTGATAGWACEATTTGVAGAAAAGVCRAVTAAGVG